jgi:hypothetical protein
MVTLRRTTLIIYRQQFKQTDPLLPPPPLRERNYHV